MALSPSVKILPEALLVGPQNGPEARGKRTVTGPRGPELGSLAAVSPGSDRDGQEVRAGVRQAGFKQGMEGLPCLAGRPLTSVPAGHPGTGRAELGSSLALPPSNPHSLLCRASEALRRPPA